jgi:fatty acid CoA ligase FadD28
MIGSSINAVLRERASLQPSDTAYTFLDYDQDPAGVAHSLTWAQVFRRVQAVAYELTQAGSIGDRAVIMAPQGLEYIIAFLGTLQAGFIAVPLSVPFAGVHDERVRSVLLDTQPAAVLTTSSAVGNLTEYLEPQNGRPMPAVIEVDTLDFESRRRVDVRADQLPDIAYLQYTSGSTRTPAGVIMSHKNVLSNFEQKAANYFPHFGNVLPSDATVVSWLPFYHDMGLILAITTPVLGGVPAVLMSPISFLQQPARWMQLLGTHSRAWTATPNFAFELTARRTTDDDLRGLDLGDVLGIISGSERIHPATIRRFTERFARHNFQASAILPSYGLAEATAFVATRKPGNPPAVVHFDTDKLSVGHAQPCTSGGGIAVISYGTPFSPKLRIVDPDIRTECPAGTVGEIWIHGDNVALGYWQKPEETERTFGGKLVDPSDGTPEEPWLRTGDLGVISDGELFIMGRIKDLLIIYGRNHYPDDIEATIQEITGGRVAAIAVSQERTEKLVAIIETKKRGDTEEASAALDVMKGEVNSAISNTHGIGAADLVLVAPGSIPITTSGKIRRAACIELYREGEFKRVDSAAVS